MKLCLYLISGFCFIKAINCHDPGDSSKKVNKPIWNETFTDVLKHDLLMAYDKFARPAQHYNTTTVSIHLQIKHIEFDELSSIFTVYSWFYMDWVDEKLKWNKSNYGNFSRIHLAQHEIWQPDITLFNSITNNVDYFGDTNFVASDVGKVTWVPPATFKALCDSSLRYWPFDTHTCTLVFGSWTHDGTEIDIIPKQNDPSDPLADVFIENAQWAVTDLKSNRNVVIYECCPEPYVTVKYDITISRRSSIYQTVIFAPAFVIILLTLATFWLPAQYGEKVLLNGITAIIIVLFLLYFTQKISIMASHTPLIVLFYSHAFYMVCFSTLIAVVVINLTRMKHHRALPWIIKKHLDGKFGEILFLHLVDNSENVQQPRVSELHEHPFDEHASIPNDEQQIIQQCRNGRSSIQTDYLKLATAIDRIAFSLYLFLFVIFGFAYSL